MNDKNDNRISAMNFGRVDENLTRSGLPTDNDLKLLKSKYQVKTIINFCTKSNVKHEEKIAKELGFNYIHLPWSAHFYSILRPYYYVNVAKAFIEIVFNSDDYPIHMHCFHGRERTGLLVAVYRMQKYDYSFSEAVQEMKQYGFKPELHFTLMIFLFLYWMFKPVVDIVKPELEKVIE